MKTKEGHIYDINTRTFVKGRIYYGSEIIKIERDESISSLNYIIPGLVDAHVHIESTMLTPLEYSKVAVKFGVVGAVTDPHEIANVCGLDGVKFMIENAKLSPLKMVFGAPSCVPATDFETSGGNIGFMDIEYLFKNNYCSHLSEMMNYPGVIYDDVKVLTKLGIARKYNKIVDGHAPMLEGKELRKYVRAGISTDHECTSVKEALEKIALGMKIMLRESSASKDFNKLITLVKTHPSEVMFCTNDCHPDELIKGYINELFRRCLLKDYDVGNIIDAATVNAVKLYNLNIGLLRVGDAADFVEVDNMNDFNILSTFINGEEVYNKNECLKIDTRENKLINKFYVNEIKEADIKYKVKKGVLNVIEIIEDSLLTRKLLYEVYSDNQNLSKDDVLKVVVVNRYSEAKASIGYIKGFKLLKGAIAGSIAHDSHNIIAVGYDDKSILDAIQAVQKLRGGLVVVNDSKIDFLSLPVAGLMSDKSCKEVSNDYNKLSRIARELGINLNAPFMTLAFMSLLVIPEIKIGDKGLFDVNEFDFIDLQ